MWMGNFIRESLFSDGDVYVATFSYVITDIVVVVVVVVVDVV